MLLIGFILIVVALMLAYGTWSYFERKKRKVKRVHDDTGRCPYCRKDKDVQHS